MYKVSETVLPIYINGHCPIIKTCSDVTLNLSSKDSSCLHFSMQNIEQSRRLGRASRWCYVNVNQ